MDEPGSKVEDIYITDWIALENILASGKFDKQYLENMENDICEQQTIRNGCMDPCEWYTRSNGSKCVSKSRIKKFRDLSKITGKNRESYKIISVHQYDIQTVNPAFYFMMEAVSNKYIYIIFSSGIGTNDYFSKFETELTSLVENIYRSHNTTKIILCGHSSGCVFAIYTGMIMKEKYDDFFKSNVIVVGSAPFKYSDDGLFKFSYLPNVKIFASCIEYQETEDLPIEYRNTAYADEFIFKGPGKYNYNPITYVSTDVSKLYKVRPISELIPVLYANYPDISIPQTINITINTYHSWSTYYNILTQIYGKGLTWDKVAGGENPRKRRKTRKRKRTRKRIRPIVQQHKSSRKHTSKLGTSSIRKRLTSGVMR